MKRNKGSARYTHVSVARWSGKINQMPSGVDSRIRENFYPVMEMGELDLLAEFVDLFRQYGCTEEHDLQVRDGTRYLLRLFHAAGDSWMAHRESYETEEPSAYNLVHKAWTGVAGVRARVIEPPAAGTYGAVFRQAVDHSR